MGTNEEEGSRKKSQPQLVKLNKALKLAEQWVNNMSKSSIEDKSASMELEGRPAGLGIGATVPKESKFMVSSNPVERKLLSKLQAEKRKVNNRDDSTVSNAKGNADEDSEEDESESKTKAFSKKRPLISNSPLTARKKHR